MALPRPVTRSLVTAGALTGLGAAFLAGTSLGDAGGSARVGEPDASPAAYAGSDLTLAADCDELLRWYVERGLELVGPYGWGHPHIYTLDGLAAEDSAASGTLDANRADAPVAAPAPVRATNGQTGTNVQEAGVDEPDVVKTDGRTLFRVQNGDLVTHDVSGGEVRRLAAVDLPGAAGGDVTELLLAGDTVVALSHDPSERRPSTEVATLDVSDPAAPEVTHTVEYDAGLVTARLHGGVVRVVLEAGLPDLDF